MGSQHVVVSPDQVDPAAFEDADAELEGDQRPLSEATLPMLFDTPELREAIHTIVHLTRSGSIERVAHGIYRLRRFPAQRFEDVIVACLWAGHDVAASHETALAVHELTNAMPAHVHVTVPRSFRGERQGVVVHVAPLAASQRTSRHGVPVTTVERTVADVAEQSGTAAATEAASEGIEFELVTRRRLRTALAFRARMPRRCSPPSSRQRRDGRTPALCDPRSATHPYVGHVEMESVRLPSSRVKATKMPCWVACRAARASSQRKRRATVGAARCGP